MDGAAHRPRPIVDGRGYCRTDRGAVRAGVHDSDQSYQSGNQSRAGGNADHRCARRADDRPAELCRTFCSAMATNPTLKERPMKLLQASIRKISLTLFALLSTWTCGHVYADTPVRIAYPSGLNGQIALVADKAGIATRNGLQAQFNLFQNGPPMMEALASGNVDVVVTSYQPFTTFRLKQPDAVTVIAQLGHSSYALVAP